MARKDKQWQYPLPLDAFQPVQDKPICAEKNNLKLSTRAQIFQFVSVNRQISQEEILKNELLKAAYNLKW